MNENMLCGCINIFVLLEGLQVDIEVEQAQAHQFSHLIALFGSQALLGVQLFYVKLPLVFRLLSDFFFIIWHLVSLRFFHSLRFRLGGNLIISNNFELVTFFVSVLVLEKVVLRYQWILLFLFLILLLLDFASCRFSPLIALLRFLRCLNLCSSRIFLDLIDLGG